MKPSKLSNLYILKCESMCKALAEMLILQVIYWLVLKGYYLCLMNFTSIFV